MNKKVALFLLVLFSLAAYAPALRNGFVWDDQALILRDPLIRSWRLIGEGFTHFLFTDASASDFYRPLQRLSYTLDYAVFFLSPMGYHLVSILWHAAAAIALFLFRGGISRDLQDGNRCAGFGSRSWRRWSGRCIRCRARPSSTSPVAPIRWRRHLVSLRSSWRCACSGREEPGSVSLGFGAGFCFLASALSKEMGLIFLLVWLIIFFAQRPRRPLLGAIGLVAGVSIAYLSLRLPAEHFRRRAASPARFSLGRSSSSRAVAEYAGLLLFPWRLHMERDVETHPSVLVRREFERRVVARIANPRRAPAHRGCGYRSLAIASASSDFPAARCSRSYAYLPISGLITLNATVAEHWLYLPSAFLFLAATRSLSNR